ncbi:MAG: glycosyltransferase family 2 protein [Bacteroidota bacterium]
MPRISVIVPIYKVEEYIEKCLSSILDQTYKDFEIIVVNDQSPDNSALLSQNLLEAQDKIPFNIVHREKNGGLSAARNSGIAVAKGDFLLFIDSDDWIDQNMLLKLIESADSKGSEIIVCRIQQVYDNSDKTEVLDSVTPSTITGHEALLKLFNGEYPAHICKLLIAKTLFTDVQFPVGKIYEDVLTLPYLLQKTKSVTFINDILYNYLQRPGSITKSYNSNIEQVIEQFSIMNNDFKKLVNKSVLLSLRKYIYRVYHVIVCQSIYYSKDHAQIETDLIKCRDNIKLGDLFRLLLKKPSRTITSLLTLKISTNRFDKIYRKTNH